jgi:hypothetical protein
MLSLKNITDEEHKEELQQMILNYYDEVTKKDDLNCLPWSILRSQIEIVKEQSTEQLEALYSNQSGLEKRIALGIYNDDSLIGFASTAIFADKEGGIYQIYIKDSFRHLFEDNKDQIKSAELSEIIDEYFKNRGAKGIYIEAPYDIEYLLSLIKNMGFRMTKDYPDAIEMHKEIK